MKKGHFILCLLLVVYGAYAQTYNPLWIPDTLGGPTFNLTAKDTFRQMIPGNQTITAAYNGNWWGPTLMWYKNDSVHMVVTNNLNDSTTVHWHGMHLPAIMDGGPHQIIPPHTVWKPYWKVTNNAATYWYHPHLHMDAEKQLDAGLGGLIIIHDSIESVLALPRSYGIDDIPLVLTDRKFTSNQIVDAPYGDSMVTNGVLHASFTFPAQVVRLRILDAAIERSYNIGFSDGSTFYVIASDGGLLDAPVPLTRFLISPGERVEILVNLTGKSGSLDLMAYNSTLPNSIGGGDNLPGSPFANDLASKDFEMLHMVIGSQTSAPITSIPTTLTTNTYLNSTSATVTRTVTLSDSTGVAHITGPNAFILNHHLFDFNKNDYQVEIGNTEIWELKSSSFFSHPFHIHDVEFNILSINGSAPPAEQAGWKDVILVKSNQTVKFIARFQDYADSLHPFMFHCHIALHEDEGMMAQFIVVDTSTVTGIAPVHPRLDFSIYPNPAKDRIYIDLTSSDLSAYYLKLIDALGRTIYMLPRPELKGGIDISSLAPGTYEIQIVDDQTKATIVRKFVKD